jgi:hypothetical protein
MRVRLKVWKRLCLTAALLGGGLACVAFGLWPDAHTAQSKNRGTGGTERSSLRNSDRVEANFDAAWREKYGRSPSNDRASDLAATLAELALGLPEKAMAFAFAENDPLLRPVLIAAALRGWASVAPDDAANWSLRRPFEERGSDIAAVLMGAAHDTRTARDLALRLVDEDPALAHDHGCSLVLALTERGDFSDAADFALGGPLENREAWLALAFGNWAEHEPQTAAAAALRLTHETVRDLTARTVIARWSMQDPRALATFALTMPPTDERRFALSSALVQWSSRDLAAASAWINQLEPSTELDSGVAAVATQPPLIAYQPEIAASWAGSIVDSDLRARTLAQIIHVWSEADPVAARKYAETSPEVASDRESLLANLGQAFGG